MKLDILVLAAHPDDAELGCGGTIAKHVALGMKVGVVDLTRGELGTRGTVQTRDAEAREASAILKLSVRENLGLADGFFQNDKASQLKIIEQIRTYQPEIILANAISDRHPDHARAATLVKDACFLSGLVKIETADAKGKAQQPWRPKHIYNFIQSEFIKSDFVIDVTEHWQTKIEAVKAYSTQFFDASSTEPEPQTFISRPEFLDFLAARAIELGNIAGVKYAEGFTLNRYPVVETLNDLH